ncbi:MAG: aa3-type cytochrome c oxidase subunit IV [Alphaproteobacteria bacterium]|nr:aa3-type cytochrome c oxidase subunit IV [Alphaproteobacteria bacterium]
MAIMDPEVERHRRTWIGFTWFMKLAILHIVVILALLAIFLL